MASTTEVKQSEMESGKDFSAFYVLMLTTAAVAIMTWILITYLFRKLWQGAEQQKRAHSDTFDQMTQTDMPFLERTFGTLERRCHDLETMLKQKDREVRDLRKQLDQWPREHEVSVLREKILDHRRRCPLDSSVYITEHGDCFHASD